MPEDQIAWVTITLDLPEDIEKRLETAAHDAGMSLQCYCLRVLLKHLIQNASPEQQEQWRQHIPATLRRNSCDHHSEL